jgi:hypothetical protein
MSTSDAVSVSRSAIIGSSISLLLVEHADEAVVSFAEERAEKGAYPVDPMVAGEVGAGDGGAE